MSRNKKIILSALLLAMLIILSRFLSIKTPIVTIGFSFVPTMLCAIWLGPKWTLAISILRRFNRSNFVPIWFIFCRLYNNSRCCSINLWIFIIWKRWRYLYAKTIHNKAYFGKYISYSNCKHWSKYTLDKYYNRKGIYGFNGN